MPPAPADPDVGIDPVPKEDPKYASFVDDQGGRVRKQQPDLLFVGDSITWNWTLPGPEPWRRLSAVWNRWYGDRRASLLACGGEQTQNLLWRMARGQFDGLAPRVVVLLIGTNNIGAGQQTPEQTQRGIEAAVDALLTRMPSVHLLLLGILPRGPAPVQAKAERVNAWIREHFVGRSRVTVLDVGHAFLRRGAPNARLYMEAHQPDRPAPVHPNAAGMEAMAHALEPTIARLLNDRDKNVRPPIEALRPPDLARLIDHTILRPDARQADVQRYCDEAQGHEFWSVCVNPVHVAAVAATLAGSVVRTCSVVGFPFGATPASVKAAEAAQAALEGADEIDMVLAIGALKDGRLAVVRDDIASVRAACREAVLKVIIETCLLDDAEKQAACRVAVEAGADFVKTSTGFGGSGATAADVALMRRSVGEKVGVKASGGVRDFATARTMIAAGASRIGTSAGPAIVGAVKG